MQRLDGSTKTCSRTGSEWPSVVINLALHQHVTPCGRAESQDDPLSLFVPGATRLSLDYHREANNDLARKDLNQSILRIL